jgi:hypothetical protein
MVIVNALAAAVLCLGLAVGCERTVPGTVAMTTQPGPAQPAPTTRPTAKRPATPRPTTAPTPTSPTSEVPAPANALTMTCKEFMGLDEPAQKAVVKAILTEEKNSPFGMLGEDFATSMATTMCPFLPDSTVHELLMGTPP